MGRGFREDRQSGLSELLSRGRIDRENRPRRANGNRNGGCGADGRRGHQLHGNAVGMYVQPSRQRRQPLLGRFHAREPRVVHQAHSAMRLQRDSAGAVLRQRLGYVVDRRRAGKEKQPLPRDQWRTDLCQRQIGPNQCGDSAPALPVGRPDSAPRRERHTDGGLPDVRPAHKRKATEGAEYRARRGDSGGV